MSTVYTPMTVGTGFARFVASKSDARTKREAALKNPPTVSTWAGSLQLPGPGDGVRVIVSLLGVSRDKRYRVKVQEADSFTLLAAFEMPTLDGQPYGEFQMPALNGRSYLLRYRLSKSTPGLVFWLPQVKRADLTKVCS